MKKLSTLLLLAVFMALPQLGTAQTGLDLATDLKNTIINDHNTCRRDASATLTNLTWDDNLAEYAKRHAIQQMQNNTLEESSASSRSTITGWTGTQVGENLGSGTNSRWSLTTRSADVTEAVREALQKWFAEKQHYDRSSNTCQSGQTCGHYTQVVWESTTSVGCGVAVSDDGTSYVIVCDYGPGRN